VGNVDDKGDLVVSVDASFGQESRSRSRTGMVAMLFGSPVFWMSQIQKLQALSTAEAELNALSSACEELEWIKPLVESFDIPTKVKVLEDNQAVIAITEKPRNNKFKLKSDYIRTQIENGFVSIIQYNPSNLQAADALTKVTNGDATQLLGLVNRGKTKNTGNVEVTASADEQVLGVASCTTPDA